MTATNTIPAIRKEIAINAPAAKVFAALTDPEQLTQWWGSDDSYRCATMTVDLRPGGKWRTAGKSGDGSEFAVEGEYQIVEPPRLLQYTWKHDWGKHGSDEVTVVRFELTERNGVTNVAVTHSGWSDAASREDHDNGWGTVLGWLKGYSER